MKGYNMLIWITQLGLSVIMPLAGFVLAAFWLRQHFGLGAWVLVIGFVLGLSGAVSGLRSSLEIMERMDKKNERKAPPPVSFNDHD